MVYVGIHALRHLKEELAWAIYRQLWAVSNVMLSKSYTTKEQSHLKLLYGLLCGP